MGARIDSELQSAGFALDNASASDHPDIIVDELRLDAWVAIEDAPGNRVVRMVRALIGN
jgi:hypothetical protein